MLILLAALLVNSMIETERNAQQNITNIQTQAELKAVTDLVKADALQSFNYTLRKTISNWLSSPTNYYTLNLEDRSWQEIQQDFARANFGDATSTRFVDFMANDLQVLLESTPSFFAEYAISLEGNADSTKPVLASAVRNSVNAGNFFSVVGCPDGNPDDCGQGTFYVNLNMSGLTDAEFESLPKIVVSDGRGNVRKESILPRTNFKIYVPLRIFRAIAIAKSFAHDYGEDNTGADFGLFSPRVHNEIEQIQLGMCDESVCNWRTNPFTAPQTDRIAGTPGSSCFTGNITVPCTPDMQQRGMCNASDPNDNFNYPASQSNQSDLRQRITTMVKRRVCKIAQSNARLAASLPGAPDIAAGLELVPSTAGATPGQIEGADCAVLNDIAVDISAMPSKKITQLNNEPPNVLPPPATGTYAYSGNSAGVCPFEEQVGPHANVGFGIFLDPATGKSAFTPLSESDAACANIEPSASPPTGYNETKAYCAKAKSVSVTLAFKENNSTYKVDKQNEFIFRIRLLDNTYHPFTGKFHPVSDGTSCFIRPPGAAPGTCDATTAEWHCYSVEPQPGGLSLATPKCVPG